MCSHVTVLSFYGTYTGPAVVSEMTLTFYLLLRTNMACGAYDAMSLVQDSHSQYSTCASPMADAIWCAVRDLVISHTI